MAHVSQAKIPFALAFLAAGATLSAQGIFGVPASDPAGIGRSGAGVAFGRSLEAASINPALLSTLQGKGGVFLAGGQEFQGAQETLQSNQNIHHSTDRNRLLPAFGAGWVLNKRLAFGLKLDNPFMRHATFSPQSTARFLGDELSIEARRMEAQASYALREDLSVGIGVGVARIGFASGSALRVAVPVNALNPVSTSNPSLGLLEQQVRQEGSIVVPSASLGLRWALNARWTFGFAFQGPLQGNLKLDAEFGHRAGTYTANDGLSAAPVGIGTPGGILKNQLRPRAGDGRIQLPARASLGFRHRTANTFTWEVDLRYTDGGNLQLPTQPALQTPSGLVANPGRGFLGVGSLGLSAMGELGLGRDWVLRGGLSLDQALREDSDIEPTAGGASSAAFSLGASYRLGPGELLLGYQVRQSQDVDTRGLDGVWSITGYRSTGTVNRVENSGHLYAIGYKVSF